MNCVMLLRLQDHGIRSESGFSGTSSVSSVSVTIREKWRKIGKGKKAQKGNYGRMLALASHALAEGQNKPEPKDLWLEPLVPAVSWKPCSDQRSWEPNEGKNGYILVTANGGMNQQRVAVCNAVAVARLLNSTLVVPKFLYSSIWRDVSQFSDIYQEEHFINYLTPDIRIVKELPKELQSLDLEATGSVVTDVDIPKEAKPSFYSLFYLRTELYIFLDSGIAWHLIQYHFNCRDFDADVIFMPFNLSPRYKKLVLYFFKDCAKTKVTLDSLIAFLLGHMQNQSRNKTKAMLRKLPDI